MGRSRGGFSTKIHAIVDGQGRPLHVTPTPGQKHEMTVARELLAHAQGKALIADAGYDSNDFLQAVRDHGLKPVICPNACRSFKPRINRRLYRRRYLVEIFFHNLKRFRAIATRYEKTARNFLALVQLASARIWLDAIEN